MRRIGYVLVVLLSGCATKKEITYIPIKEVTEEKVERRDTTLAVSLDPYHSEAVIEGDSSRLENPYVWSEAVVKDGRLHHSLHVKEDAKAEVTLQQEEKTVTHYKEVPVEVTREVEKKLTPWQKVRQALFVPLLTLTITLLGITLYLKKKKS
jgi:hypothetical protein